MQGDQPDDDTCEAAEAAAPLREALRSHAKVAQNAYRRVSAGCRELWDAAHAFYPEVAQAEVAREASVLRCMGIVANSPVDPLPRFARASQRSQAPFVNPWQLPMEPLSIRGTLALTYKGLASIKNPLEQVLYPRLIWELQPRTIIEFGSLQGGSGLWFADQMSVLCEQPGEVHSFELHTRCISPRARHPRLKFHQADLTDLRTLDEALLKALLHPWLVVDDAHVDVVEVFQYLNRFMLAGDYYVVEDVPLTCTRETAEALVVFEEAGFLVDTYYADAFGYNLTSAPNAWFRKF